MHLDIRGKGNIRKIGAVLAFAFQAFLLNRLMTPEQGGMSIAREQQCQCRAPRARSQDGDGGFGVGSHDVERKARGVRREER